MTTKQYRRMCVFALRMVPFSIGNKRWQNVVRHHVRNILHSMNCEGDFFHYRHIIDWDNVEDSEEKNYYGNTQPAATLPCDFLTEYCWEEDLRKQKEYKDGTLETIDSKVGNAVCCCIRAAMDVAVEPSAGVVGFTVGDLKKMWEGGELPAWVAQWFAEPLDATVSDDVPVWL